MLGMYTQTLWGTIWRFLRKAENRAIQQPHSWVCLRKAAALIWKDACTPVFTVALFTITKVWKTWVRSLGREGPLEEEVATHSSVLAWRIPMDSRAARPQSMGSQRVGHDWATKHSTKLPSFLAFWPLWFWHPSMSSGWYFVYTVCSLWDIHLSS